MTGAATPQRKARANTNIATPPGGGQAVPNAHRRRWAGGPPTQGDCNVGLTLRPDARSTRPDGSQTRLLSVARRSSNSAQLAAVRRDFEPPAIENRERIDACHM